MFLQLLFARRCLSLSQVSTDYLSDVRVAAHSGNQEVLEVAVSSWRERCRSFVKRRAPADWRPRKRQRVGAFIWGRCLQSQILWSTRHKLSEFQLAEELAERGPAINWPRLNVAADMGSDGLCWSFFARYVLRLNIDMSWDASHGCNNGRKESHRRCGLAGHDWLKLLTIGIVHQPWGEKMRYEQCLRLLEDFLQHEGPATQPGFIALLPAMARERGELHRLGEPGLGEEYWEDQKEFSPFACMGKAANSNRFMDSQQKGWELQRTWSLRTWYYSTLCCEMG